MVKIRKSPIKHKVRTHRKNNKVVHSYTRGHGRKQNKIKIPNLKIKSTKFVLPKYLYHGTSLENVEQIKKSGLLLNKPHTEYTVSRGFSSDVGISLAVNETDAVFFAVTSQMNKHENGGVPPAQAIIKINTEKLNKYLFFPRSLFGRENAEVDYMNRIPTDAIESIKVRSFSKVGGKLKVDETIMEIKNES